MIFSKYFIFWKCLIEFFLEKSESVYRMPNQYCAAMQWDASEIIQRLLQGSKARIKQPKNIHPEGRKNHETEGHVSFISIRP